MMGKRYENSALTPECMDELFKVEAGLYATVKSIEYDYLQKHKRKLTAFELKRLLERAKVTYISIDAMMRMFAHVHYPIVSNDGGTLIESEGRFGRLHNLLSKLNHLHEKILQVDDHEGGLSVNWESQPTAQELASVITAWYDENESNTDHYVNGKWIVGDIGDCAECGMHWESAAV